MNSLVVYYSRSNITKKLAENIAGEINADIEEIIPKVNYDGKLGYARAIKDAVASKIVELEALKYNPDDYDMIYLGSPVWASKSANPLISYIKQNEGSFKNIKIFLTAGSSGFDSSFQQIEKFAGIKAQKTLELTTKDVKNGNYSLKHFIE